MIMGSYWTNTQTNLSYLISFERTMLIVDERFIVASLINNFGKHAVSTSDDGVEYGIHLKHASFWK
jgi:hypothetical protein